MRFKAIAIWAVIVVILAGLGYSLYVTFQSGAASAGVISCPTEGECIWTAHIHAYVPVMTCGSYYRFPTEVGALTGPHTHEEKNIIHWHDKLPYDTASQRVTNASPLTLGAFFDAIDVPFSQTRIYDYKNGDKCPDGTTGTLKIFINGVLNENPRAYIWQNHDIVRIFFDGRTIQEVQQEVDSNPITFPKLGRG